jgi:hypothetical protein
MHFFSNLGICLLGLSSAASAAAIQARQAGGISQQDFDTIFLYEQYAAAAYCQRQWSSLPLFGGPSSTVSCAGTAPEPDNCPAVEQATTATLKVDK